MRGPTPKYYLGFGSTWTTLDAQITWTEVTDQVMSERGASCTRGRSSELDDMRAGTFNCTLKNNDRRFDPTYTSGPYYRTNLTVPGTAGGYASTPDAAALDITGDIDLRCRVALTDWTPSGQQPLIAKWNVTGNQLSYELRVTTAGLLQLLWSTTGAVGGLLTADSTVAPTVADGATLWVRATMDVNDGAGNRVIRFYTSTDDTRDHSLVNWTQLGSTVTTAGTTSIFSGTATLVVGARSDDVERITGTVEAAAVLNGIGGTVVANPVFSYGLTPGATSLTDSTGKVWTINSPASIAGVSTYLKPGVPVKVTGTANGTEYPVFRGFAAGWPQDYDRSNKLGYVNLQCTDGMAKLATAGTPSSVLAMEIETDSPHAWWMMSETTGSSFTDASSNGFHGTWAAGGVSVGESIPGSPSVMPAVRVDGTAAGVVNDSAATLAAGVDLVYEAILWLPDDVDDQTAEYTVFSQGDGKTLISGGVSRWMVLRDGPVGAGKSLCFAAGRNNTGRVTDAAVDFSTPRHVAMRAPGGDPSVGALYIDGVEVASTSSGAAFPISALATATRIAAPVTTYGGFEGCIAQLALYDTDVSAARITAHATAWSAPWDGDTTGARIDRILGFGWPSDLIDTAVGYTTLGPAVFGSNQLQLIKGYEKAEQGRFFISRSGKATFLDRYYNQTVTAGSTSQATFSDDGSDNPYGSFAFDYDDRLIYNRVRAARVGGGQVEVYDQTSIDTYGEQVDSTLVGIEVESDALARGAAEQRLDRYKNPQLRVRPIELRLHGMTAAQQADILDLELGYRVTVERTPQRVGSAITQETIIEGISHRIAGGQWSTTLTLSPVDTRQYAIWGTTNWGDSTGWGY